MRRSHFSLGLLAVVMLAGLWWPSLSAGVGAQEKPAVEQGKNVEVVTQIMIEPKTRFRPPFGPPEIVPSMTEDFLAAQPLYIAGPLWVEKAVQTKNLGELKSYKQMDRRAVFRAIRGSLSVRRPLGTGNVFELSFRGADESEGAAILNAIVGVYTEQLDLRQQYQLEKALELATTAKDEIQQMWREEMDSRGQFRQNRPPGNRGSSEVRGVLTAAGERREARRRQSRDRRPLGLAREGGRRPPGAAVGRIEG